MAADNKAGDEQKHKCGYRDNHYKPHRGLVLRFHLSFDFPQLKFSRGGTA